MSGQPNTSGILYEAHRPQLTVKEKSRAYGNMAYNDRRSLRTERDTTQSTDSVVLTARFF